MMWSVLLFVTLCMVLMKVIPSSQLPAEDNEMFAFQNGQSGDGPPGKRDVSFDGQSGDGPPGKRDVSDSYQLQGSRSSAGSRTLFSHSNNNPNLVWSIIIHKTLFL
uniref:Uncharacterized protein n=1 Tax=Homalodisca liturata TaxID=320908 RepID=A0A1B6JKT0_9HEMI